MAERRPAINASPLIFLARTDLLDLLQLVSPELVVPLPVAEEIQRRGPSDPTAKALSALDWLQIVNASHVPPEVLN